MENGHPITPLKQPDKYNNRYTIMFFILFFIYIWCAGVCKWRFRLPKAQYKGQRLHWQLGIRALWFAVSSEAWPWWFVWQSWLIWLTITKHTLPRHNYPLQQWWYDLLFYLFFVIMLDHVKSGNIFSSHEILIVCNCVIIYHNSIVFVVFLKYK